MRKLFNSSFRYFVFILALSAAAMLTGCSKDDDNNPVNPGGGNQTNKITINGGGYNNQTVDVAGAAGYSTSNDITGIVLQGTVNNTTPVVLVLSFPGAATGTYNWQLADENASSYAGLAFTTTQTDTGKIYVSTGTNGSTQITEYGAVGQSVKGSFSGDVFNIAGTKITISGSFSITRGPDEE